MKGLDAHIEGLRDPDHPFNREEPEIEDEKFFTCKYCGEEALVRKARDLNLEYCNACITETKLFERSD